MLQQTHFCFIMKAAYLEKGAATFCGIHVLLLHLVVLSLMVMRCTKHFVDITTYKYSTYSTIHDVLVKLVSVINFFLNCRVQSFSKCYFSFLFSLSLFQAFFSIDAKPDVFDSEEKLRKKYHAIDKIFLRSTFLAFYGKNIHFYFS